MLAHNFIRRVLLVDVLLGINGHFYRSCFYQYFHCFYQYFSKVNVGLMQTSKIEKYAIIQTELCRGVLLKVTFQIFGKRLRHRCFPVNFAKFLKFIYFYRPPPVANDNSGWVKVVNYWCKALHIRWF